MAAVSRKDSSNGTNISLPQPQTSYSIQEPPQLVTFRRVIFTFVIILALFGNLIVIRAIRTKGHDNRWPTTWSGALL